MARNTSMHSAQRAAAQRCAIVSVVLLGSAVSVLPGCYSRVTRASGFGADQYSVSEPYQRNGAVDDWIFGKQAPSRQGGSRIPPTPQRD